MSTAVSKVLIRLTEGEASLTGNVRSAVVHGEQDVCH
jgi:hypothetical protein